MSDKPSAQSVIEGYRKRQKMSNKMPVILLISAAVLLIVGAAIVIFWVLGSEQPLLAAKPTETLTPTWTATATAAPTATETPTITPTQLPTDTSTPDPTITPALPFEYTIQEGDTLFSIAEKFNTDLATVLALNPSIDSQTLIIRVGDKILIPAPDTQLPTVTAIPSNLPAGTIIVYVVVKGDTLEAIALAFNSTVERIVSENKLENANDIRVGDSLNIPVNLVTPVPTPTKGTVFPTIAAPTNTPAITDTPKP